MDPPVVKLCNQVVDGHPDFIHIRRDGDERQKLLDESTRVAQVTMKIDDKNAFRIRVASELMSCGIEYAAELLGQSVATEYGLTLLETSPRAATGLRYKKGVIPTRPFRSSFGVFKHRLTGDSSDAIVLTRRKTVTLARVRLDRSREALRMWPAMFGVVTLS